MIWVGFFIFWAAVAIAMICLFKSVARHDRVLMRMERFETWRSDKLEFYIGLLGRLESADEDDLEELEAARRVLRDNATAQTRTPNT